MEIVNDYRYILPEVHDAGFVENTLGKPWVCPYCNSQSTAGKTDVDTGWVMTPLRQSAAKWICVGCCIDIYSTCISDEFYSHPYLGIIEDVARVESLDVKVLRRLAAEHQLDLVQQRTDDGLGNQYSMVLARILSAIADCSD